MQLGLRRVSVTVAGALALVAASSVASAAPDPCGKFDLSNGIDCKVEVEASCSASCTPLTFEAGCEGGCTADVTVDCTGGCEEQCLAECDPAHLDCVAGCHTECEQPCITQCQTDHPDEDCPTVCKASCNTDCEAACGVTPSDCLSHCHECCIGACTTSANLDCDIACYAKLEGQCTAQCDAPSGALFCNGQYVYASDVDSCIDYLLTQGIDVDVSARGSATCNLSGCTGENSASGFGCSAAPGEPGGGLTFGAMIGVALLGVGAAAKARKKRR
ncbi:MAG TPA: hypothetical protein VL400_07510 [Polyangiaceae bacterium]|jgi:hypothetical protein|nr:hypothetical protein [Polyangiaceae bacterium]